ncbi:hypothetical protein BY458DRAFT_438052 [Sporodiniella umbellata]|nr:hypothetical protein BY458DRAFT_438052 [Sporodiniella umbellata]
MGLFLNQLHVVEEQRESSNSGPEKSESQSHESIREIYEIAGKVLYYISASNWNPFYAKLKNSVHILVAANENSETNTHEIRALSFASLNVFKLHTLLTEFSPHFHVMKINGKLLFAKMLRSAIWKWISTKPSQFAEIFQQAGQTFSGSEILFDMCNSAADSSRKKAILWPLQTILITLTPHLLTQAFMDDRGSHNQKIRFPRHLRKALDSVRTQEIAATCYVDLCRAASYIPPSDDTILWHIADDIESLLREKIWDFSRSLSIEVLSSGFGYTINQQALISDYFLSQLRLNPAKTLSTLVTTLSDSAPIMFKQALVDACLAIALEEKTLSWHPTLPSMYSSICTPLRQIFAYTVRAELSNSHKTRYSSASHLISSLLKLFRLNPYCALKGDDNRSKTEENGMLITSLTQLMKHQDRRIKCAAMSCLSQLHETSLIMYWGPSDATFSSFYRISSQALVSVARQMLDVTRQTKKSMNMLLDLLANMLDARCRFLSDFLETSVSEEACNISEHNLSMATLEVALLVSLCSTSPEICSKAIQCLGYMCNESKLMEKDPIFADSHQAQMAVNSDIYLSLLSEEPDTKNPRKNTFVGRKAQQKRVRKHLRMISIPTSGSLLAWEEVWKRWRILTPVVIGYGTEHFRDDNLMMASSSVKKMGGLVRPEKLRSTAKSAVPPILVSRVEIDDEKQTEWQHYTGFLAALGGIRLAEDIEEEGLQEERRNRSVERIASPVKPLSAEKFVTELIDMCTSDNVVIREAVKSTLGNDLSVSLYDILFRQMEASMAQCFGPNREILCNSANTLLVEQSVLILKMILERLTDNDWLLSVDFSTLMIYFANYINHLPQRDYTTMRTMIMMCHLIEVLLLKKDQTLIRDDVRVKNRLLEIVIEWISNFNLVSIYDGINSAQNKEVQQDLDQVCMKSVVSLLLNLPLQTSEKPREGYPTAQGLCSSKLLSKSCTPTKQKDSYWGPLKESAVNAISNLLSANVEAGLKSTLAMGYHEDPRTRSAFMKVLSNILNQGAQFDTLAENTVFDRYDKLVDLLVESDIEIALSLGNVCSVGDSTGVAETLLATFESKNKILFLLETIIEKEVVLSEQESTLFRGTNMASRLLSMFSKSTCVDYVKAIIQPAMESVNNLPEEELTWEMNPQAEPHMGVVMKNKQNVCRVASIFLDAICKSSSLAPPLFRQQLAFLSDSVKKRFPDASKTQVGGFVFLRLFNPAILTPESFGISKQALPKSKDAKKILLQATRLMQNIANNVMFGAKEPHLISLNDFITSNLYRVANFLREIAMPLSPDLPKEQNSEICARLDTLTQMKLHRYLYENLDKISRDLSLRKSCTSSETQRSIELKHTMESFSKLLGQLGPPSDTTKAKFTTMRNYAVFAGNTRYNEFMRRYKHRDIESMRSLNAVYQGGVSRDGNPVFYLITRYLPPGNFEHDLFVYYMLRVMESCLNRPFEFVVDLTRFSEGRELTLHWCSEIFQLTQNEYSDSMVAIHFFNPNFYLQRSIRKLPRTITNKMVKKIRFSNSTSALAQYIAPSEIQLPKETYDVEKDVSLVIKDAFIAKSYRTNIPVQIKIGSEYLQVITTREQEIFWSLNTVLNNVYSMTDLTEIYLPPISKEKKPDEEGEIHITLNGGKANMNIIISNREKVYKYLLERKKNFETNITDESRGIRPKDVPGCILNMTLLNLGNRDPVLRVSAYHLLCSLCISFRFSAAKKLMFVKDICVPYNDTDFIFNISELIASSESHLTLEFLNEWVLGFSRSSEELERQVQMLEYVVPWLKNLVLFVYAADKDDVTKIRDIVCALIKLTTERSKLYEQIQRKIWSALGAMEDLHSIIIDCLLQYSVEKGMGSPEAEDVTNTIVTMSNDSIRGKIVVRLRKELESTAKNYQKTVVKHAAWDRIVCLVRCMTAISFFHERSAKSYFADCCHIVSLLASTGPTLVRSSIHGFVINTIHLFVTTNADENHRKKLQTLMGEVSDDKYRVHFGLNKSYANAFTITDETLTDNVGTMSLLSLEVVVQLLMDTVVHSACDIDTSNAWRARWMSLVTSMTFQYNPALQPRAFVILGCLAQDEIDDDLLFQILVILGNEMRVLDDQSPQLTISILMCLQKIVRNLSLESRYLQPLFWIAIAMAEINCDAIFPHAIRLIYIVLNTLGNHQLFDHRSAQDVLMEARLPFTSVLSKMDEGAGVNFDYFSFAITSILLKGYRFTEVRDDIFKCLTTLLDSETKMGPYTGKINTRALGYFVGLLLFAAKNDILDDLVLLANIPQLPSTSDRYTTLWSMIDVPDNMLLASFLVYVLNLTEGEAEKLFLYEFFSKTSISSPTLFTLIYELIIPKMNAIIISSDCLPLVEAAQGILIAACGISSGSEKSNGLEAYLQTIRFPTLNHLDFGRGQNSAVSRELMSHLLRIICE